MHRPREHSWLPNEEGYATTDMESDQLHVPASLWFVDQAVTLLFRKGLVHSGDKSDHRHFDLFVVSWSLNLAFN